MKPSNINIMGINYSIEYCDNAADVDIHKREALLGQIDYWTRTIRVHDNGRSESDVWQILMHEVLHGIADALKLKLNNDDMHDELDILASALTDTLVRNQLLNCDDDSEDPESEVEDVDNIDE